MDDWVMPGYRNATAAKEEEESRPAGRCRCPGRVGGCNRRHARGRGARRFDGGDHQRKPRGRV